MGKVTGVAWTDHTFNPWMGCAHVSPGCAMCYAETIAKRYGNEVWGAKTQRRFFGETHWREPLRWDRAAARAGERRRVFCASMADVFEPRPDLDEWRAKLWDLIGATPNLDWLLLTKRPEEVQGMVPWGTDWPENVWLGTSCEDQRRADERIPVLLGIPARLHFISAEPLLGPIRLRPEWLGPAATVRFPEGRRDLPDLLRVVQPHLHGSYLRWVILGGESGSGHRPMEIQWARDLAEQCQLAGVSVFCKQDSGPRPGMRGRLPDGLWALKEFPYSPAGVVGQGSLL